ncbi:Lar family restriction alleviation protein [Caulobacter sp. FWC2]|uniref:Lar family restriction alleviation protein n=1 Tax=Caulobacter sp. FWC2 TaxID=69664 RepID=UPI000C15A7F7|nr:Lar family restriction alleviation protein [Caulobacter sp. FWC2]PIB91243.1 hypothetical protein CSW62_06435 [Caulobacter sp. FWC2]
MAEDQLKPCPFCGGTNLKISETARVGQNVTCVDCGTNGPFVRSLGDQDEAAIAWNRRAPAVSAERPGLEAVAKKVEPEAFARAPDGSFIYPDLVREVALERADDILALFSETGAL